MADDRARELVSHARLLEERDAEVARKIESVAGLLARTDEIRASAASVAAALAGLPGELAAVAAAERAAGGSEAAERAELADAERRLDAARKSRRKSSEAIAEAERELLRARETVAEASARVARAQARRRALLEHKVVFQAETEGLAVSAREAAAAILDVPSVSSSGRGLPGAGLAAIEEWGGRAHAALFVVRSSLEAERQRIVDEANALAAAVLSEPLAGASVALVRQRLEAALT